MSGYPHAPWCPHCGGTGRIRVTRPLTADLRRIYDVPCNAVTRAQVNADRPRPRRWIGWATFAAASIAAGVMIAPVSTLLATVLR